MDSEVKADEQTHGVGVVEGAKWPSETWGRQKCLCLSEFPNVQLQEAGGADSQERGQNPSDHGHLLQADPADLHTTPHAEGTETCPVPHAQGINRPEHSLLPCSIPYSSLRRWGGVGCWRRPFARRRLLSQL